jgi:hypothetical protein
LQSFYYQHIPTSQGATEKKIALYDIRDSHRQLLARGLFVKCYFADDKQRWALSLVCGEQQSLKYAAPKARISALLIKLKQKTTNYYSPSIKVR